MLAVKYPRPRRKYAIRLKTGAEASGGGRDRFSNRAETRVACSGMPPPRLRGTRTGSYGKANGGASVEERVNRSDGSNAAKPRSFSTDGTRLPPLRTALYLGLMVMCCLQPVARATPDLTSTIFDRPSSNLLLALFSVVPRAVAEIPPAFEIHYPGYTSQQRRMIRTSGFCQLTIE